jgi:hypothetical protein
MTRYLLAILCAMALVLAFGCKKEEAAEGSTDNPPAEESGGGGGTEAAMEEGGGGGGGGVCDKAEACCNAYVAALPGGVSVEQACGSIASVRGTPAADQSCQTMIDGWRQGLQAANIAVPSDCQ